ncbi:class I SAM-dependent methyltransferase [Azomonas macrocytogenes]|uniref:SAM-dependent methyltransferase n=1 Tax=Azomonas macrocytogenes TaxID=69962 RepID=A0A839T4R3_AZOMA|nr:methyltransferase domain-containing protein [Azomonas macrocytogenes]MBB3104527.1 SAM-dependent methyltransferase [Azomonas macrocytogenes]
MIPEPFTRADERWLDLVQEANAWFEGPLGQQLLAQEREILARELKCCFGSYLVHYAPFIDSPLELEQIGRCVRIGPPLSGVEIQCHEQAWPLGENVADAVILQHALDFSRSPHALLREAARSVRPGGHIFIIGINPWSLWRLRSTFSFGAFHQATCIKPSRVGEWLNVLGFALEKRRYGCYCPPLSSLSWRAHLAWLESLGQRIQMPTGGFYVLTVRKMMVGLRPLRRDRREHMGQLIPLPVAKVSRRDAKQR